MSYAGASSFDRRVTLGIELQLVIPRILWRLSALLLKFSMPGIVQGEDPPCHSSVRELVMGDVQHNPFRFQPYMALTVR